MKKILIVAFALSLTGCEKGYFGLSGYLLSPARTITGLWTGTLVCSENNAAQYSLTAGEMTLDLKQNGNDVTGVMTFTPQSYSNVPSGQPPPIINVTYSGSLTGTISGVKIDFISIIGNGCVHVKGTFTSSNMDGMINPNDPPYITCGDALNSGQGSKGREWHLQKN